jgi:phage replication O-like protein O
MAAEKPLVPNFTLIPNVVLEKLMPRLSKAALKVLLAVARKTYGFHKDRDAISLTQLQRLTGLGRAGVVRGITELGSLMIVTKGANRDCNEYELNIEFSTAELVSKWNWFQNGTSSKTVKKVVPKWNTQKKEDKRKNTSDSFFPNSKKKEITPADPVQLAAFESFYQAYPLHKNRQAAEKAWLGINPDEALNRKIFTELENQKRQRTEQAAADPKAFIPEWPYPATWLNNKRWEDEAEQHAAGKGGEEWRKEVFING